MKRYGRVLFGADWRQDVVGSNRAETALGCCSGSHLRNPPACPEPTWEWEADVQLDAAQGRASGDDVGVGGRRPTGCAPGRVEHRAPHDLAHLYLEEHVLQRASASHKPESRREGVPQICCRDGSNWLGTWSSTRRRRWQGQRRSHHTTTGAAYGTVETGITQPSALFTTTLSAPQQPPYLPLLLSLAPAPTPPRWRRQSPPLR